MGCAGRHHTWAQNPPAAGTVCVKPNCGAVYAVRGAGAPANAPPSDRAARVAAAFASLRTAAPSVVGAPTAPPDSSDEGPIIAEVLQREPNGWQKGTARKMRRVFFGALDMMIEALDRIPCDADDDDETDVEDSFARSLATWFPDGTLSPGKDLLLACGFAGANAWAGSKRKPTGPKPEAKRPVATRAADEPARPQEPDINPASLAAATKGLTVFGNG